ncbi:MULTISPECIES: nitrate reductase molybdenum cofactor assembly chaperone [Asticcacaulis]|uniref:nitrate reductase molybdenum cofactor assembly chaperone n=1 Tax=Asticcacaulis TaxID=76890 RepID=UPI0026F02619|nr:MULTISPECIES: nitrate reductase molybdenum cofactor assembly chaperone [Asticcacaulis]HTM82861.1 nitrate reductase molybdenum cofactor assembly chaperone [Asticcacaulis sp.]
MAMTYKGLACLLSYPTEDVKKTVAVVSQVLHQEGLVSTRICKAVDALIAEIEGDDLYDLQERYIGIFDRTRSLSLNLYEHVHGESRERGQAMVALLELYRSRGLELDANELPDFLPVFLEFLSTLTQAEAASFLVEAVHVLEAMAIRLKKRDSRYQAVFDSLVALAGVRAEAAVVAALLAEPEQDPDDLEALDKTWEETAVTFGPGEAGCPKAEALVEAMRATPPASRPAPRPAIARGA